MVQGDVHKHQSQHLHGTAKINIHQSVSDSIRKKGEGGTYPPPSTPHTRPFPKPVTEREQAIIIILNAYLQNLLRCVKSRRTTAYNTYMRSVFLMFTNRHRKTPEMCNEQPPNARLHRACDSVAKTQWWLQRCPHNLLQLYLLFTLFCKNDQSSALDSEITVDCVICHGLLNWAHDKLWIYGQIFWWCNSHLVNIYVIDFQHGGSEWRGKHFFAFCNNIYR